MPSPMTFVLSVPTFDNDNNINYKERQFEKEIKKFLKRTMLYQNTTIPANIEIVLNKHTKSPAKVKR